VDGTQATATETTRRDLMGAVAVSPRWPHVSSSPASHTTQRKRPHTVNAQANTHNNNKKCDAHKKTAMKRLVKEKLANSSTARYGLTSDNGRPHGPHDQLSRLVAGRPVRNENKTNNVLPSVAMPARSKAFQQHRSRCKCYY
jgi:hypothetical protein